MAENDVAVVNEYGEMLLRGLLMLKPAQALSVVLFLLCNVIHAMDIEDDEYGPMVDAVAGDAKEMLENGRRSRVLM